MRCASVITIDHARQLPSGRPLLAALCLLFACCDLGYFLLTAWFKGMPLTFAGQDWYQTAGNWINHLVGGLYELLAAILILRIVSIRRVGLVLLGLVLLELAYRIALRVFYPPKEYISRIFGIQIDVAVHPVLNALRFCHPSWGILFLTLLCLLSASQRRDFDWRIPAATPAVDRLFLEVVAWTGPVVFVQHANAYQFWLSLECWGCAAFILLLLFVPRWSGLALLLIIAATLGIHIQNALRWWHTSSPDPWLVRISTVLFYPAWEIGPYLVIGWFMLRWRGRRMPDDGSPFPRRYCRRCEYNLLGVTANRCPECGAVISDKTPSDQAIVS